MKSQNERLLEYLKQNGSINAMDALRDLAIFRLASRVNDCRKAGFKIETDMVKVTNKFGETCHVAEYRLMENLK